MPTGTPATIWQPVSSTCWDNPLKREDVKRKIVGHWGTVPGQNFVAVKIYWIVPVFDTCIFRHIVQT